jgi:hypothetical protein
LHAFLREGHATISDQNGFPAAKKHKKLPHALIIGNNLIYSERQESLSDLSQTQKMHRSQGNFFLQKQAMTLLDLKNKTDDEYKTVPAQFTKWDSLHRTTKHNDAFNDYYVR